MIIAAAVFVLGLPSPSGAATIDVSVGDNFFSPQTLRIDPGDTVRWTNDGSVVHTVTHDSHTLFDSGDLASGQSFEFTFNQEGYYFYHCHHHGVPREGMWAVVIVGDPPDRNVTLNASPAETKFSKQITLSGTVSAIVPDGGACVPQVRVRLLEDVLGEPENFVEVADTLTESDGDFSFTRTAAASANYLVSADAVAECGEDSSDPETVLVAKKVGLTASPAKVAKGRKTKLTVTVQPCLGHEGDPVHLLQRRSGKFRKIAAKDGDADCKAVFKKRIKRAKTFKGRSPATDADHIQGTSRAVKVRLK